MFNEETQRVREFLDALKRSKVFNALEDIKMEEELTAPETTGNAEKVDPAKKVPTEKADASAEICNATEANIIAYNKTHGWIKKPDQKAMWEILMLIAWIQWGTMCAIFFINYLSVATTTGVFLWSWTTGLPFIKECVTSFTTVVAGSITKLLQQWYQTRTGQSPPDLNS